MLNGKLLLCVVLLAEVRRYIARRRRKSWHDAQSVSLPFLPYRIGDLNAVGEDMKLPDEITWARVREGVPPPLCAGRCAAPPMGPVCAFDAAGTARTFATLCELEAVSCHESTYYAITSLGEC